MTTIGIAHESGRPHVEPVHRGATLLTALLACGVLASLLYVATDLIGGLLYPGYSFNSQAISELGAIGAPSQSFVDPMFVIYDLLALVFGIGVFRAGAGHNRALRVTGALLIAFATVGLLPAREKRPGRELSGARRRHVLRTGT